jgi:hypothetical protein
MSYEVQDASLRIIGISTALLVFGVAASMGASAWWYVAHHRAANAPRTVPRQTSFTNGPAAEPDILRDRRAVAVAVEQRLNGYAWVDRDAGVARIPIERAMALLANGVKPAPAPQEPGQVP